MDSFITLEKKGPFGPAPFSTTLGVTSAPIVKSGPHQN